MPSGSSTKVIIAGGGLGGLVLGILLQRAGIDYFILEQSVIIRPIGAHVILSSLVLPLMEQLGLLQEIQKCSMPFAGITFWNEQQAFIGQIVSNDKRILDQKERYGHYDQCIPRADLYNILLSRIPKDRIKLGKRLVTFQHLRSTSSASNNNDNNNIDGSDSVNPIHRTTLSSPSERVMVRCSDGTFYYGQVLVGADGASSAVRQSLYRQMKEEGILPKVDQEEQQHRQVSLLGITGALSSKKHPDLADTFSKFKVILNRNSPYMNWFMPIRGNRYCWLVTKTLDTPMPVNNSNSNLSDWGPSATDEMTKAVRHLAGPDNTTMGEMIDNTDRQSIYRVMLEERAFKSWFAGRTVLIGDACHKSVPFIGKGASESILDAVVLASLLYDMPSSRADPSTPSFKSYNNLQKIFRKYYHARADFAKQAVNMSGFFTSILVKEGWTGHVIRKVVFKMNTGWIGRVQLDRVYYQRIQASFLPQVPDHGSAPCRPHVVSKRPVVGLVDYYGSRHGSRDGDHDGYGDDEQEEEGEYDDLSTIDRTSSIAGRSVKSTALSKYRMGGGEDRVLDHARVDEFLTGIDQNPIAI